LEEPLVYLRMPQLTRYRALGVLLGAVLSQERHELGGQADGSTASAGLHVAGRWPSVTPVRAEAGLAATGAAASVLVLRS
jgi:hypothetical protein